MATASPSAPPTPDPAARRPQTHAGAKLATEDCEFLFDLETDPGETRDRKADQPDLFERFRPAYARWEAEVLEPVPLDPARA